MKILEARGKHSITTRRGTEVHIPKAFASAFPRFDIAWANKGALQMLQAPKREDKMFLRLSAAVAASILMAGVAYADPIEGNWKTDKGSIAAISSCGGSFCIKLISGKFAGRSIGKFKADGGNKYSGNITDPETDKTYSGKGALAGSLLKMSGCVLGGLICRSQNWQKQ
jgi:uncharacterized protein (DUF2147 family)